MRRVPVFAYTSTGQGRSAVMRSRRNSIAARLQYRHRLRLSGIRRTVSRMALDPMITTPCSLPLESSVSCRTFIIASRRRSPRQQYLSIEAGRLAAAIAAAARSITARIDRSHGPSVARLCLAQPDRVSRSEASSSRAIAAGGAARPRGTACSPAPPRTPEVRMPSRRQGRPGAGHPSRARQDTGRAIDVAALQASRCFFGSLTITARLLQVPPESRRDDASSDADGVLRNAQGSSPPWMFASTPLERARTRVYDVWVIIAGPTSRDRRKGACRPTAAQLPMRRSRCRLGAPANSKARCVVESLRAKRLRQQP